MTKKFDLSLPHAQVYVELGHGFGHVRACIRNLIGEGLNSRPDIRVSMQTGNTGDGHGESYAWKFGVDTSYELLNSSTLAEAAKVMKRIEKKMQSIGDEFGEPANYAEYVHRILVASGVDVVFVRKELRDHRNVDDLPMYNTKRDANTLRKTIAGMEHEMLMATDATYRNKHREAA